MRRMEKYNIINKQRDFFFLQEKFKVERNKIAIKNIKFFQTYFKSAKIKRISLYYINRVDD